MRVGLMPDIEQQAVRAIGERAEIEDGMQGDASDSTTPRLEAR